MADGMVVRTNMGAANAKRQLSLNNSQVSKSLEKLSSGFRINRAADDASGLAISEKMKAQIKGLETASANSQDGISLIQTAEGGAQEIHDMLNRMTELATKSANGTIQNDVDREAIQREVDDLNSEISRIASSTNFNGINLLDGNLGGKSTTGVKVDFKYASLATKPGASSLQAATETKIAVAATGTASVMTVGNKYTLEVEFADAGGNLQKKSIEFTAANADSKHADNNAALTAALKGAFGDGYNAGVAAGVVSVASRNPGAADQTKMYSIGIKDSTGTAVANTFGAVTNTAGADAFDRVDFAAANIQGYTGAATEKIEDHVFEVNGKKFAFATATGATAMGKLDPSINVIISVAATPTTTATGELSQMAKLISDKTGIKAGYTTADTFIDLKAGNKISGTGNGLRLQVGDTNDSFNKVTVSVDDLSASGIGTASLDVSTQDAAGASIKTIKTAINKVSTNRANMGSLQNRLEHTINNLDTTSENMTAANSRIRDTDMAKEMMNYTKNNILVQAAQAMLAQANQAPQGILQLLQ